MKADRKPQAAHTLEPPEAERPSAKRDDTGFAVILGATALFLLGILYPATLIPVQPYPNGGPLGLLFLGLASAFAWGGFALKRTSRIARWLWSMPATTLSTYVLVRELIVQHLSGWRHW